jgi:hypothetical protein
MIFENIKKGLYFYFCKLNEMIDEIMIDEIMIDEIMIQ